MKQMTFIQAMKDYFGIRPGETATHFMKEVKELTDDDKAWFRANLPLVGYEIVTVTL